MTTARRKSNPVALGVEAARLDANDNSPAESHLPSPNIGEPHRAPHNNLSLPRSPLIGREHEVAIIQQLLLQDQVGLLTLSGPGGIGKTRLAMQVAANVLDHFVDGVYVVSLAPISDPDLVPSAIAQTLGVREAAGRPLKESLQDYLRDKQLLLVLDNFEQNLAAAPLVSALLAACRRIKVLVTSRASLHLYGEQEFPVPPLAFPDTKHLTTTSQTEFAAIDLFCQRARAVKPDFALTSTNAPDVAKICIGLDGLPLAIELAAARIKLFSPAALLARLNQRLTLLTGGPHDLPIRQRTLRDEIAWSYDLLTPDEQTLFRRLAVFVGGFTLEAAQTVGNAQGDLAIGVLDGVATLVNQNLLKQVAQTGDEEARFGFLETLREYGLAKLETSGALETIRHHHATFFLQLAERTEPELLGRWRKGRLAQLEADLDNFRAALLWSQTDLHNAEIGLRLAGALAWFAHFGNRANEGHSWLEVALQHVTEPTAAYAKALWGIGLTAMILGDFPGARTKFEESAACWRAVGSQYGLAVALRELGAVAYCQGDLIPARSYLEESVVLCRAVESQWDLALALNNLATTAALQGQYVVAYQLFEEEIDLFQALNDGWGLAAAFIGLGCTAGQQGDYRTACTHFTKALTLRRTEIDKWNIAEALSLLGEALQRQGNFEQAVACYRECLLLLKEVGDKAGIALIFHNLGTMLQAQGDSNQAACLLSAAAGLRKLTGGATYNTLTDPADYERAILTVRISLSEEAFAIQWSEGQTMSLEQAVAFALAISIASETSTLIEEPKATAPQPTATVAGLTTREIEVLRFLVQGLTYAQIADKLVVSRRTVNAHTTSIYSKLGVTSRALATHMAVEQHLV